VQVWNIHRASRKATEHKALPAGHKDWEEIGKVPQQAGLAVHRRTEFQQAVLAADVQVLRVRVSSAQVHPVELIPLEAFACLPARLSRAHLPVANSN